MFDLALIITVTAIGLTILGLIAKVVAPYILEALDE